MKHQHYETETVSLCIVFFLMSIKAFDYVKIICKCQLFLRTITKQTNLNDNMEFKLVVHGENKYFPL